MKRLLAFVVAMGIAGSALAQMPTLSVGQGGMSAGLPTGPVDIVASPLACWSLRSCSTPVPTNLVNICNSGDANCANISSLANGDFNVAAAQGSPTNCGGAGGTCTIKTWYDQSGNGNNITQATIANRPTLSFGCTGSGRPCAVYSGAQTLELASTSSTLTQPFSTSVVSKRTSAFTTQQDIFSFSSGGLQFVYTATASTVGIYAGASVNTAAAGDNLLHSFNVLWSAVASTANLNVDGTNNISTLGGNSNLLGNVCIATGTTGSCAFGALIGQLTEVIVWPGDHSASFVSLCHNQFVYWGTSVSC
jgi:Alpha-L-arabinofuranosidase B, catalytic